MRLCPRRAWQERLQGLIPFADPFCRGFLQQISLRRLCRRVPTGRATGRNICFPPVAPARGKWASPGWELLPQQEQHVPQGFVLGVLLALGTAVCRSGLSPGAPAQPRASGCSVALLCGPVPRLCPRRAAAALEMLGSSRRRWPQESAVSSGRILQSPEGCAPAGERLPGSAPSPPHSFDCNPLIVSKKHMTKGREIITVPCPLPYLWGERVGQIENRELILAVAEAPWTRL